MYQAKGLGPAAGSGWYTADKNEPICTTMERLATLPFVAHPGEAYVYGYNTDILGCVVERASGMPLDEFIRDRHHRSARHEGYAFLSASRRARSSGRGVHRTARRHVRARARRRARAGRLCRRPARQLRGRRRALSTARDYGRFLEMVRSGGMHEGRRILCRRAVELMTTNQIGTLRSTNGLGFGYGFETTDRYGANGIESLGAFGWSGAYGTAYRVDPESRLVIVMMIQVRAQHRGDCRAVLRDGLPGVCGGRREVETELAPTEMS